MFFMLNDYISRHFDFDTSFYEYFYYFVFYRCNLTDALMTSHTHVASTNKGNFWEKNAKITIHPLMMITTWW